MARLPTPKREDLAPDQQVHYDAIMESRGHVSGPFTVLMYSPDLAARVANVGAYARFESTLPVPHTLPVCDPGLARTGLQV